MIASSFWCPTLQMHVEHAPFNLDSSGRPRLDLRAFQGFRLSFVPGRLHGCLLIPVVRRCRCTWNRTVQVSAWSFPIRLSVWGHHGRERPIQLCHFPDSLAAISGFAVTLVWSSMNMRIRPRLEFSSSSRVQALFRAWLSSRLP